MYLKLSEQCDMSGMIVSSSDVRVARYNNYTSLGENAAIQFQKKGFKAVHDSGHSIFLTKQNLQHPA
jgi:hypothetical protein